MAPIKRKADIACESAQPEKKHKQKQNSSSTAKLSVLKDEEPAFPRGGASVLTPLEHKQIQIQAKQDVLFEQSTGKKPTRNEFEDVENDEDMLDKSSEPLAKSKRKPNAKHKKVAKSSANEETIVRIEGLSYKVGRHCTWK